VGSGKSTLLRVLLGLIEADDGKVTWNGQTGDDLGAQLVPPRTAYKPQSPRVFGGAVGDNVRLGLPADEAAVWQALEEAELAEDVKSFPEGLDTAGGPRGVKLSGGQRQRLGLARALLRRSELTVIDDFSNGLDIATEGAVWRSIERIRDERGATFIIASHRPMALRGADRVVVMDGGRVEVVGTLDEVRRASATAARVLDDGLAARQASEAAR
jgi:ATP-binding cassette subfamily B protein